MSSSVAPEIDSRAPPIDLSHHYSRATNKRVANNLKKFYKYFSIPGIGNLAGGLPNANYFPYDTLEASTALPERFKPTPNDPVDPPSASLNKLSVSDSNASATRVLVPHDSADTNQLRKIDIASALQYGTAQGYPALYSWIRQFTAEVFHPNVPYKGGPEVILDCGSTDGLTKVFEVFYNHWDKDRDWIREREGLIVEEFAYPAAVAQASPRDVNVVPIAIDDEGMKAAGKGGLQDVMENWDFSKGKRPHMMYTVTMGQNPTSGLLSITRRKEIYKVCSDYDIIIVEDDPYWYLQYPSANELSAKHRGHPVSQNYPPAGHNYNDHLSGKKSSGFPFLDSLVPSYLNVDTDGRVIRLDTFSKTVAPGCRLGWITAQPAIIERLFRVTEGSTSQPSGFVQSLIAELLVGPYGPSDGGKGGSKDGSGWKAAGWVRWLEGLRGNYERRMNIMASTLEENKYHLNVSSSPQSRLRLSTKITSSDSSDSDDDSTTYEMVTKTPMYTFTWPMAGMFLWLEVNIQSHPLASRVEHHRLMFALWILFTQPPYLTLVTPGQAFAATPEIGLEKGYRFFRLCFAAVDEDKLEGYLKGFVGAFQHFWGLKKVRDIDHILRDEDGGEEGSSFEALLEAGKAMAGREEMGLEREMGFGVGHVC